MENTTPKNRHSVLLVEDDKMTRQRLHQVIDSLQNLTLMAVCENLAEARQALQSQIPQVLLTDLGLPDGSGIDLIREIRQLDESVHIMVISVFGDERNVLAAIEAGASGYLLKDGDTDYIGKAIGQLIAGESPISAGIARHLLKKFQASSNKTTGESQAVKDSSLLTLRETEVLALIAKGYTYNEVATNLEMSRHTVNAHIKNIYRKLN